MQRMSGKTTMESSDVVAFDPTQRNGLAGQLAQRVVYTSYYRPVRAGLLHCQRPGFHRRLAAGSGPGALPASRRPVRRTASCNFVALRALRG
jgi:hypothetical protein